MSGNLFEKGHFEKIDNNFMSEGHEVLTKVQEVQVKFNKRDTDTFINELRDSIVGYNLGFDLVNIDKHGFDCKTESNNPLFLEVKAASFSSKTWQATFNDTTFEKAEAFKSDKLYLALAVWKDASDLLFICYGQNPKLGEFLEEKIRHFKNGNTVRSTQSIGLTKLIFDYGFKILTPTRSKKEILECLIYKNSVFKKINPNIIQSFNDFKELKEENKLQGN